MVALCGGFPELIARNRKFLGNNSDYEVLGGSRHPVGLYDIDTGELSMR